MSKEIRYNINIDAGKADRELSDLERTVDEVEGKLEDLDRSTVEPEISADTSTAEKRIETVDAKRKELDGAKAEMRVEVDAGTVDRARRNLQDVGDKAESIGDKARAGSANTVNAVRDITGPLGEVSTQVGDFGDAFTGAAEIAGSQLGLTQDQIEKMAGVLGVGGLAFGAAFAFWNMFRDRAEKARQEMEAIQSIQRSIAQGQLAEAADELVKKYAGAIDGAERLGFSTEEAIGFITGATDKLGRYGAALDITGDDLADITTLQNRFSDLSYDQAQAIADVLQKLHAARTGYQGSAADLQTLQRRQFEATKAIGGSTDAFLEQAKDALPAVREEILRYVGQLNGIPPERITKILADADPDDVAQVQRVMEELARERRVIVRPVIQLPGGQQAVILQDGSIRFPGGLRAMAGGGVGSGPTLVGEDGPEIVDLPAGSRVHPASNSRQALGAPMVQQTIVHQHFPPGITPAQVEAARRRWERRNGPR